MLQESSGTHPLRILCAVPEPLERVGDVLHFVRGRRLCRGIGGRAEHMHGRGLPGPGAVESPRPLRERRSRRDVRDEEPEVQVEADFDRLGRHVDIRGPGSFEGLLPAAARPHDERDIQAAIETEEGTVHGQGRRDAVHDDPHGGVSRLHGVRRHAGDLLRSLRRFTRCAPDEPGAVQVQMDWLRTIQTAQERLPHGTRADVRKLDADRSLGRRESRRSGRRLDDLQYWHVSGER